MSATHLIFFISFADALQFGLVIPFTTTLMLRIGANHTAIGVLCSIRVLFNVLSEYVIIALLNKYGFNRTLTVTLAINCVTFFMLYAGPSAVTAIFYKSLFILTCRTKFLCQVYLYRKESDDRRLFLEGLLYLSSMFGLIVGPIVSGILLTFEGGTSLIFYIASIISLVSSMASVYLDDIEGIRMSSHMRHDLRVFVGHLRNIAWRRQWTVLLLKYTFITGMVGYATKFPLLLYVQFRASPIMIGCVHAYMKLITIFADHLLQGYEHFPNALVTHLRKYFAGYLLFVGFICYTTTYEAYYTLIALYILCQTYIERKWSSLYRYVRMDENDIESSSEAVSFLAKLITPIVLGFCCDMIEYNAVRGLALGTASLSLILSYLVPSKNLEDEAIM